MEKKILIRNAKAIVTCDTQDHVYWNADILVEGPKITTIGPGLDASGAEVAPQADTGDGVTR